MWTSSPTLSPSSGDFLFEVASLEGLTGLFNFFFSKAVIFTGHIRECKKRKTRFKDSSNSKELYSVTLRSSCLGK